MEIHVDGERVEFTLEGEKNLFEIYRALADWIGGQGGKITGLSLNGGERNTAQAEDWVAVPADSIQSLEIRTRSEREQNRHELSVMLEYFSLLDRALAANEPEPLRQILFEYPYIRTGMAYHLRDIIPAGGNASAPLDSLESALDRVTDGLASTELSAAREYVKAAAAILSDRIQEFSDPKREAFALGRMILAFRPSLENVPILLQTGKDREAMQNVLSFTELAIKATRLLAHTGGNNPEVEEFCRELNGVLKELSDAFEARDSVLIGDLLEYEVAPRTDRLSELLQGGR